MRLSKPSVPTIQVSRDFRMGTRLLLLLLLMVSAMSSQIIRMEDH